MIARIVALTAIAVAIAASGCGSDNSGEATAPTVSIPAVTSPLGTTSTAAPAGTTTVPATPPSTTSTTERGNHNPNGPDSATHDVPPPPGSPQETFERQCEANPQACG